MITKSIYGIFRRETAVHGGGIDGFEDFNFAIGDERYRVVIDRVQVSRDTPWWFYVVEEPEKAALWTSPQYPTYEAALRAQREMYDNLERSPELAEIEAIIMTGVL